MSHFTTIKTMIRDITALKAACAELGLELLENTEARGFSSNRIRGDFVIKLKGPYDVALNRQSDGSYALNADLWQGRVESELGPDFGRLRQLYGVHKSMAEARRRGLSVTRRNQPNGTVRLALCRV